MLGGRQVVEQRLDGRIVNGFKKDGPAIDNCPAFAHGSKVLRRRIRFFLTQVEGLALADAHRSKVQHLVHEIRLGHVKPFLRVGFLFDGNLQNGRLRGLDELRDDFQPGRVWVQVKLLRARRLLAQDHILLKAGFANRV